jgi:hypothetical protein
MLNAECPKCRKNFRSSSWMKWNMPAVVGIRDTDDLYKENLTY